MPNRILPGQSVGWPFLPISKPTHPDTEQLLVVEAVLGPAFSIRKKNFIYTHECSEHDCFLGPAFID